MNFGQLAMYDQIVRYVEPVLGKNEATNTTAKLGAAIAASFCSLVRCLLRPVPLPLCVVACLACGK